MEGTHESGKTAISQKFLETLTQVKSTEPEFSRIQYLVQMQLGSVDMDVTAIYSILEFQGAMTQVKHFRDFTDEGKSTILHSVIAVDEMDSSNNRFHDVVSKGFTIGEGGLFFPCGISSMNISKSSKETPLLISKVAIKKTEIIKSADLTSENIQKVVKSQRFDSIYVDEKTGSESHPFKENYILLNSHQILPSYLVFIKYVERSFGICEVCCKSPVKVYCENDHLDMCQTCDMEYHPLDNKVSARHKRVDILEKNLEYDFCKIHTKVKKESFCVNCRISLCINCQLNGFHADPRYKSHKVVSMHDCFEFLKDTRKVKSPMMIKIKNKVTNLYNQVKSQSSKCMAALAQVEKQLQKIYQQTQANLVSLRQKYLDDLLSMEVGYRHKLDEIVWMEYFIKFQIDKVKPADYIQRYFTHLTMQEDFFKGMVMPTEEEADMNFDFELQGSLKIVNKSMVHQMATPVKSSKINDSELAMSEVLSESMVFMQPAQLNSPEPQSKLNKGSRKGSLKLPIINLETPTHCNFTRFGSENRELMLKNKLIARTIGTLSIAFRGSKILVKEDKRASLCLNLIKDGSLIPKMILRAHYIKSHMPTIGSLIDLFVSINGPILLMASYEGKVFGAFCDTPWQAEGTFGGMSCFIFSIDNNLRISPVVTVSPGRNKRTLVFSQDDSFGWGATDLVMDQSFTWLNDIHCDYTTHGSEDMAPHPLCDRKQFQSDGIEVWSISY